MKIPMSAGILPGRPASITSRNSGALLVSEPTLTVAIELSTCRMNRPGYSSALPISAS